MIISDLHTHTVYSHGKCTVSELAEREIECGVKHLAISEHGKSNMFYGLSDSDFVKLKRDIDEQNERLKGKINIMLGIEANLLGNGKIDLPSSIVPDIVLAGYHRGIMPKNKFSRSALHEAFSSHYSDTERNTDEYISAIENNPCIKVITHPNEYIRVNIERLARVAEKNDVLLEINSRHITMTEDELKIAANAGAKFIIGSDAHLYSEIATFEPAIEIARRAGVLSLVVNYVE